MRRHSNCIIIAALTGLFVSLRIVQGQTNIGPGEQRFNAAVYKASHNSYERDESLASQIDDWNCWCLELDLVWHTDNQIRVQHGCSSGDELLFTRLTQIAASVDAGNRVTVVYLEMKGACEAWPARSVYRNYIRSAMDSAFFNGVYPAIEFKTTDQHRWPSYQELLRRGYFWIIILDEEETGFADDDYFFGMARGNPPTAFEDNSVLINSDDDDDVPNFGNEPDRWLFRAYPTPVCGPGDDADYFHDAAANGYNFVATNCIDHAYTMITPTHSPAPFHVAPGDINATQYGTLGYPYRSADGFMLATLRVSPMVPIVIETGVYDVSPSFQISRPMVLKTNGGLVRIE